MGIETEEIFYSKKDNVIIIDPNKVILTDLTNNTTTVKDRYIKQEDLVMYAGLKAFSKGKSEIFGGSQPNKIHNFGEIAINFLNPLKDDKTHKNFFTTQWTDVFTDKSIKETMLDPETFGIKSIEVTENASMVPKIIIEFIDVRGKTLLEKGDNNDNPYNLFYSLPYPSFLLTIKGYYGKALTYPLVLLKTNTTFDPSSGDYIIKCEFLSRTFAIFNDFLLVYGVAAPYMFPIKGADGDIKYEGMYILKELYTRQNEEIKADVYSQKKVLPGGEKEDDLQVAKRLHLDRRLIDKPITIFDLLKAAKEIHVEDLTTFGHATQTEFVEARSTIDTFNSEFGAGVQNLLGFFETTPNSVITIKGSDFIHKVNGNIDTQFNGNIKEAISNLNISFKNLIAESSNKHIKSLYTKIFKDKATGADLIDIKLFDSGKNIDGDNQATSVKVTELFKKIETEVSIVYNLVGDVVIEFQRDAIKTRIGFDITIENVIRIFMNSMQVFLMLMNLTTKKAYNHITKDTGRHTEQKKYGEYIQDHKDDGVVMYPWPNYYVPNTLSNGDTLQKRAYPGNKTTNKDWPEVKFIDELYKAFDVLKALSTPPKDVIVAKNTALISPFLNVVSLEQYNEFNELDLCKEILNKINLSLVHDGLIFKDLPAANMVAAVDALSAYDFVGFKDKMVKQDPKKVFFPIQKMSVNILEGDPNLYTNLVTKIKSSVTDPKKLGEMIQAENDAFMRNSVPDFNDKTNKLKGNDFLANKTELIPKLYLDLVAEADPLSYTTPSNKASAVVVRTSIFDSSAKTNNEYSSLGKIDLGLIDGKHPYSVAMDTTNYNLLYGFETNGKVAASDFKYEQAAANTNAKINNITALTYNNGADAPVA